MKAVWMTPSDLAASSRSSVWSLNRATRAVTPDLRSFSAPPAELGGDRPARRLSERQACQDRSEILRPSDRETPHHRFAAGGGCATRQYQPRLVHLFRAGSRRPP